jgi:hypothetical protein
MKTFIRALYMSIVAAATCVACGSGTSDADPVVADPVAPASISQAVAPFSVMDPATKQARIVDMLEGFVPIAEGKFSPPSTPTSCPTSGTYSASSAGVGQERGESGIAYGYATLLHATTKTTLGGFPRSCIQQHLILVLNDLVSRYGTSWGGPVTFDANGFTGDNWQAGFVAFEMGWAAHVLDADVGIGSLATSVRSVVTAQANQLLPPNMMPQWIRVTRGDSHAEDNAWHSSLLAFAAAMYGSDPNNVAWDKNAKSYAINCSTRSADLNDRTTRIDGDVLANWVTVPPASMNVTTPWNLDDDYTMTNHGFFHPVYSQGVFQNLFDDQMFYVAAKAGVPKAFSFRMQEVWENVMGRFSWNDGDFVLPAGTDWVNHDYQHIPYLAGIATVLQRNDASVMESRAITRLLARQQSHGGSFYGMSNIGYETDILRNVAQAWWIHQLLGTAPTPTSADYITAFSHWTGKYEWPSADRKTIISRGPNAFVSMSWADSGASHPTALIVPSSEGFLDDPVFIQYFQQSGVGTATGTAAYHAGCAVTDPSLLSTTSEIMNGSTVTGKFSATAWPDGTTMLLDQATKAAFVFAFENDQPGLNGPRPAFFADGTHTATTAGASIAGTWTNIANRFGFLARGHLGFFFQQFDDVNPNADLTDPHIRIEASGDTTVRNRGSLILPLANAQQTALADADVSQPTLGDPNWSALSGRALDGTGRIAVTRWDGAATSTGTLTSSLGVPIPDRPFDVVVRGSNGNTTFSIDANDCSAGYKEYFWASASGSGSVTVHPISETLARATNGTVATTLTARYADGTGGVQSAQAQLAPNDIGFMRALDQGLVLVVASATSSAAPHGPSEAYDGSTSTSSHWSSAAVDVTTSPQDLTLDFGKPIDMGGVTMMPLGSLGPTTYTVQTSATGAVGSFSTVFTVNAPQNTDIITPFSAPLKARFLRIHVTAGWTSGSQGVAIRELDILQPAIDVDAQSPLMGIASSGRPQMRLAKGGFAQATVRVRNGNTTASSVTVSASAPAPIVVSVVGSATVTVPPQGFVDVLVNVTGAGATPTSGTSVLTVNATGAVPETIDLVHTDNLALNEFGTAFPRALSSSEDPAFLFPANLANDGDLTSGTNYWVSGPADLSTSPQCVIFDLGTNETVGRTVMTPRTNYGPQNFTIQTATSVINVTDCSSQTGWTTRSTQTGAANGAAITSTFTAVTARYVRARVTSTWYRGSTGAPPAQTQVREFQVYPN